MRIAQISPLHESVPPKCYGGTERIVSYLTEALVRLGHDVTLFAAGDSVTSARLRSVLPASLRLADTPRDPVVWHLLQLSAVARHAQHFDVIHFHTDFLHFPVFRNIATPHVTTLHGRLDNPELAAIFREFPEERVISISDSQRRPLPHANWLATVYNGVPKTTYKFRDRPGDYLAFLGRMSPEKGPERAIEIALRVGLPLKMAAKVDPVDRHYFASRIQPLLKQHRQVEYIGEIDEQGKSDFLGGALATLFPIDWPEPFGLVMAESMACGTPVIAFRHGSVPEVMRDGATGFIVESVDEAVAAFHRLSEIRRSDCRDHYERHFCAERMARDYVAAYEKLIASAGRGESGADLAQRNGHLARNGAASPHPAAPRSPVPSPVGG